MSLHALRRWIARHPARWVSGLALGLVLVLAGGQLAAACHEISHAAAALQAQDAGRTGESHAGNGHECPTCLLAAAIGGAATAPPTLATSVPDGDIAVPPSPSHAFTPRFTRAYASRAPPGAHAIAT